MTEDKKVAFCMALPPGRVFRNNYSDEDHCAESYCNFWAVSESGETYTMIFDGIGESVMDDGDTYPIYDPWPGQFTKFRRLSEKDSCRLLALYQLNTEAFEAACKEWKR